MISVSVVVVVVYFYIYLLFKSGFCSVVESSLRSFMFYILGSSLIKIIYRSKDDFSDGNPVNKDVRILICVHRYRSL